MSYEVVEENKLSISHNISEYKCPNNCCTIKIDDDVRYENYIPYRSTGFNRKAGAFIYDNETDRVLLVQSKRNLWGIPKGTVENDTNETSLECALREVKEETGIELKCRDLLRITKIRNKATYYFVIMKEREVYIQKNENPEANDVCGITWIKVDCLTECIKSGQIVLNQHCLILFDRFLNKRFPAIFNNFTNVVRRH